MQQAHPAHINLYKAPNLIRLLKDMTELVVDIPADIAEEMKRLRFINWNEKLVKDILLFLNEREIVESILNRSKLKEKDVEEIDKIFKLDLFQKYYQTKVGSIQIGD